MPQIFTQKVFGEVVMSSRDRCMNCIKRRGTYERKGFVKGKTLSLDIVHETLGIHESCMPFVHVIDILGDT